MIEPPKREKYMQAILRWKAQLPDYEKQIKSCVMEVAKPVNFYPPADFEQKTVKAKQAWEEGQDLQGQYLDVLLYHIQGKQNMTIIQMAHYLSQTLGQNLKFWQNKIIYYASIQKYGDSFSLWEVKKQFYQYMHLTHQELSNIRIFRSHCKNYVNALGRFINAVKKAEKQEDLHKIDQIFQLINKAQAKYMAFVEQMQINLDDQKTNVSKKQRMKAKNTILRFLDRAKITDNKPNILPLQSFNFTVKTNKIQRPSSKIKNALSGDCLTAFNRIARNLQQQNWQVSLSQLRQDCIDQSIQNTKQNQKSDPTYTSIFDSVYHFSYDNHPVPLQYQKNVNYLNPFNSIQFVNYEINSEEEYGQLMGEDLDQNDSDEFVDDQIGSQQSFIVSDDEDQNSDSSQVKVKYKLNGGFGKQWIFDYRDTKNRDKICEYQMFPLIKPNQSLPLPLIQSYGIAIKLKDQAIIELVQNQTRKQIHQNLTEYYKSKDESVSKKKINQFIRKSLVQQGRIYTLKKDQHLSELQAKRQKQQKGFSSEQTPSQLTSNQLVVKQNRNNETIKLQQRKSNKKKRLQSRRIKSKGQQQKQTTKYIDKKSQKQDPKIKKQSQSLSRNSGVLTRSMSKTDAGKKSI